MPAAPRLVISTGEVSGDRLVAELMPELRARAQIDVIGNVGELGRAVGIAPIPGVTRPPPAMGLLEVLRSIPAHRRNRAAVLATLRPGDTLLTVDSPDLHIGLATEARRRGVRSIGYVSPQLWAWRPGRGPKVAAAWDLLLCLFPFEPALYAGTSLDARWVGHPAVDRVRPAGREPGVLAVFPGSRPSELRYHLADFLGAARLSGAKEVLLAQAAGVSLAQYPAVIASGAQVVSGEVAMARAERALSKSGTVTLELAVAGIPTVVAHRVHPLTWWLGNRLVTGVKHLALPNVLLKATVVPEQLQYFDAQSLAEALRTVNDPPDLSAFTGGPGVARRAAEAILSLMQA